MFEREVQQPGGRVAALGPGVDLHCGAVVAAGGEHLLGVELRFWPDASAAGDEAAGAVAEHIGVRVGDRLDHSPRHRCGVHREFGVHAGHHDVEALEQFGFLIERAVFEDVDLDAGEDAHRRHRLA